MSHVRSNRFDKPPEPSPPPDTPEGFAQMTYQQRADLHARNVELYRQLAAAQRSGQVTR